MLGGERKASFRACFLALTIDPAIGIGPDTSADGRGEGDGLSRLGLLLGRLETECLGLSTEVVDEDVPATGQKEGAKGAEVT